MSSLKRIRLLHRLVDRALSQRGIRLSYSRTIEAIERLANACRDYPGETEDWLYFNDCGYSTPDAVLVGAYWHLTEWYGGQWSDTYRALCAVGQVFSPGMTNGPEPDSSERMVYDDLNARAKREQRNARARARHRAKAG